MRDIRRSIDAPLALQQLFFILRSFLQGPEAGSEVEDACEGEEGEEQEGSSKHDDYDEKEFHGYDVKGGRGRRGWVAGKGTLQELFGWKEEEGKRKVGGEGRGSSLGMTHGKEDGGRVC
jgi:hypothetical protein